MSNIKELINNISLENVNCFGKKILLQTIVCLLVVAVYHFAAYNPQPKIVTVDVNKLVSAEITKLVGADLKEEEKAILLKKYSKQIENTLTTIAKNKNIIILTKPAVISGAKDVTENFISNK